MMWQTPGPVSVYSHAIHAAQQRLVLSYAVCWSVSGLQEPDVLWTAASAVAFQAIHAAQETELHVVIMLCACLLLACRSLVYWTPGSAAIFHSAALFSIVQRTPEQWIILPFCCLGVLAGA
jgi:hypothetical protein